MVVPVALVTGLIAAMVGCGAWNRGLAEQTITLTERELPLARPDRAEVPEEDRGVPRLRLEWQPRRDALDARNWLGDQTLEALGFELSVRPGDPAAERVYGRRALPRVGWVVFELNGPAYREIERRRAVTAGVDTPAGGAVAAGRRRIPGRPDIPQSRLVPIDAGRDRQALLDRHGDGGHLVLPAIFAIEWTPASAGGPLVSGSLRAVVTSRLTVPAEWRGAVDAPQYEVDVAVGRAGLPWITAIRPRDR
ncbi:MAG: DUF4824 family protein [Acidobacteriota bacterium]